MPHISRDFPGRGAFTPSNPPRGQRCSLYAASERSDLLRRGLATSWYTRAAAGKFTPRSASGTPARRGTRDARPGRDRATRPAAGTTRPPEPHGRRNHPGGDHPGGGCGTPGGRRRNRSVSKQGTGPARAPWHNQWAQHVAPGTGTPRGTCGPPRQKSLVGGVVLRDDLGGYTAPLAHLVAALFGPRPDFRAPLAAWPGAGAPPPAASAATTARLAGVINVGSKLFAELARVFSAEVDLVGRAVEAEGHGLGRLAPIKVVDQEHLNLLCHGC